jgi:hypothetical protein
VSLTISHIASTPIFECCQLPAAGQRNTLRYLYFVQKMVMVATLTALTRFDQRRAIWCAYGQQYEGDMKRFFWKYLLSLFACSAFFGLTSFAHANTITLDLSSAVRSGASLIGGGSKIMFDPNTAGETATFTISSVVGTQYSISVTGQNDQSKSFFDFFINGVQLGGDTNFAKGFSTITLPTFTDASTSDSFKIVNGGTGNSEGQISAVTVTSVPGPVIGAGLPGLIFASSGLLVWWHRKRRGPKEPGHVARLG